MQNMCCHPISKLDTGCAGLSVLMFSPSKISDELMDSVNVSYTFTALVHGRPPDEWRSGVYVEVPTGGGLRQWKRHKTNDQETVGDAGANDAKLSSNITSTSTVLDLDGALFVTCQDTLQVEKQQISTIKVTSKYDNGRLANVTSFVLRKLGYPVVNDRFVKRELIALPRRLKNIVKQKVCIGCYRVDVECKGALTTVGIDEHKRTQCSYWRETLLTDDAVQANC